jgi:hypothetical protein
MTQLNTLYTIPENTFEAYLEPAELHVMGSVSKLVRESELAVRFRAIVQFLLPKVEEMRYFPLRYYAKQGYSMMELYEVAKYLWNVKKLDSYTMLLINAEMEYDQECIAAISDMKTICDYEVKYNQLNIDTIFGDPEMGYEKHEKAYRQIVEKAGYNMNLFQFALERNFDMKSIIGDLYIDVSQRLSSTIFKYLIEIDEDLFLENETLEGEEFLYPMSKNIRDLYVETLPEAIDFLYEESDNSIGDHPKDADGFGLAYGFAFKSTLEQAVKFQDYELFIDYFKQYFKTIPEDYIKQLFNMDWRDVDEDTIMEELYTKSGGYSH